MSYLSNRTLLFARSHGTLSTKRLSNRRPRLESLESRTVLSTVSGVSAADADIDGQNATEAVSPVAVAGQSTDPIVSNAPALTHCPAGSTSSLPGSEPMVQQGASQEEIAELEERLKANGERSDQLKEQKEAVADDIERTKSEIGAAEEKVDRLTVRLQHFEKILRKLSREFDDIEDRLAENNPPPSGKERDRLEARAKEILERAKKIGDEIDSLKDEIGTTEDEIAKAKEKLEGLEKTLKELDEECRKLMEERDEMENRLKELRPDQDGDALPDSPPADDAADAASLLPGGVLVCLPPADLDAIAAALASQGPAGDAYDLSSLDNDTGAIDFVRWGAVDVPSNTDLGNIDLDDFESRSSLFFGDLP